MSYRQVGYFFFYFGRTEDMAVHLLCNQRDQLHWLPGENKNVAASIIDAGKFPFNAFTSLRTCRRPNWMNITVPPGMEMEICAMCGVVLLIPLSYATNGTTDTFFVSFLWLEASVGLSWPARTVTPLYKCQLANSLRMWFKRTYVYIINKNMMMRCEKYKIAKKNRIMNTGFNEQFYFLSFLTFETLRSLHWIINITNWKGH